MGACIVHTCRYSQVHCINYLQLTTFLADERRSLSLYSAVIVTTNNNQFIILVLTHGRLGFLILTDKQEEK